MEVWELEARESIRDLVARYNANGDSARFGPMLDLFAEDATLELDGQAYHGRAEIRALFEGVAKHTGEGRSAKAAFIRHFTATHQIDLQSQNEATGRCYFAVLTDEGLDHWGRYLDTYRRIDGVWRFLRRRVRVDASVPGSWAGE